MKTKKGLLDACKDFKNNHENFPDILSITPSENKVILGVINFSSGLKLPFCFIGASSLKEQSESKKDLTVVFSGAVSRDSVRPTFHRIGWYDKFPGNCLYFSDPVLDQYSNIELGWYIGRPEWNLMEKIAEVISHFQTILSPEKTFIYGSSGVAMLLCRFPDI